MYVLDHFNAKYNVIRRGNQCIAVIPRHMGVTKSMCEQLYDHWLLLHDYFNTVKVNVIFAPIPPERVKNLIGY